jgi:hypothetical protein
VRARPLSLRTRATSAHLIERLHRVARPLRRPRRPRVRPPGSNGPGTHGKPGGPVSTGRIRGRPPIGARVSPTVEQIENAEILVRTDSAGATHELLDFCREHRLRYSVRLRAQRAGRGRGPQDPRGRMDRSMRRSRQARTHARRRRAAAVRAHSGPRTRTGGRGRRQPSRRRAGARVMAVRESANVTAVDGVERLVGVRGAPTVLGRRHSHAGLACSRPGRRRTPGSRLRAEG